MANQQINQTVLSPFYRILMLVVLFLSAHAPAETSGPGIIVISARGPVTYLDQEQLQQPLQSFAKIFPGTDVQLGEGSNLQLVYLSSGLQESWKGPGQIKTGSQQSISTSPAARLVTRNLPPHMLRLLDNSPIVVSDLKTRQGMIRLRSLETAMKIRKAQEEYQTILQSSAEDDITPELVLITKLDSLMAYEQMQVPLETMRIKQPDNQEVEALYRYYMENTEQTGNNPKLLNDN